MLQPILQCDRRVEKVLETCRIKCISAKVHVKDMSGTCGCCISIIFVKHLTPMFVEPVCQNNTLKWDLSKENNVLGMHSRDYVSECIPQLSGPLTNFLQNQNNFICFNFFSACLVVSV